MCLSVARKKSEAENRGFKNPLRRRGEFTHHPERHGRGNCLRSG